MAMIDAAMLGRAATDASAVTAPFGRALVEVARERPEVVGLSADLAKYTDIAPFAEAFPERFFQVGMAEANMIGIAGGFSRVGYLPFVTTYGVFATRRAYDQVAMALAVGRANVKIVAFLPGLTTPGGPTHQAIDDLALMRALPNMVAIDPADGLELGQAVYAVAEYRGPVYLRGLRGTVPTVLPPDYRFELGRARLLRDGDRVGLVSTGIMTEQALAAAELLAHDGVSAAVLHASTLKPFDADAAIRLARSVHTLVTIENHTVVGGLGSAVAETLARAGVGTPLTILGVQDRFAEAGSLAYLLERHGLTPRAIADAAMTPSASGRGGALGAPD